MNAWGTKPSRPITYPLRSPDAVEYLSQFWRVLTCPGTPLPICSYLSHCGLLIIPLPGQEQVLSAVGVIRELYDPDGAQGLGHRELSSP